MANKYNLYDTLQIKYGQQTISTLKETSLDDENEEYLCNNEDLKVFNFDLIKKKAYKNGWCSPDAIYIKDKDVFVIEFKNQNPCNINSKTIKDKLGTSVDFFTNKIKYTDDYIFTFCLVYKNQTIPQMNQRYKQGLQKQKCCNLSDYNKDQHNSFYKTIITQDVKFYKDKFAKLSC